MALNNLKKKKKKKKRLLIAGLVEGPNAKNVWLVVMIESQVFSRLADLP